MPWPASQFFSIPLDVDFAVREEGAENDAAKIDRMADRSERDEKPLPCGFGQLYHSDYLSLLRYY